MNEKMKHGQIELAEEAFIRLGTQVNHLLNAIDNFLIYGIDHGEGRFNTKLQFKPILETFAEVPMRIADELRAVKTGKVRILSEEGFEVELLNELWLTMLTSMEFLLRNNYAVRPFDPQLAFDAIETLRTLNKVLS